LHPSGRSPADGYICERLLDHAPSWPRVAARTAFSGHRLDLGHPTGLMRGGPRRLKRRRAGQFSWQERTRWNREYECVWWVWSTVHDRAGGKVAPMPHSPRHGTNRQKYGGAWLAASRRFSHYRVVTAASAPSPHPFSCDKVWKTGNRVVLTRFPPLHS